MTATTPLPAVELPRNTFTNAALTYTYGNDRRGHRAGPGPSRTHLAASTLYTSRIAFRQQTSRDSRPASRRALPSRASLLLAPGDERCAPGGSFRSTASGRLSQIGRAHV